MSFLISYQSLGMTYGSQTLFSELSLGFFEGERLGLIGSNGSGKSTLLKIFAGVIQPDTGQRVEKKHVKLVYLAQQNDLDLEKTVTDILQDVLSDTAGDDPEVYNRSQKIIGQANFPDVSLRAGDLSGGWRKRLAITCALIKQPDLLFLDEPTNHLDLEGIIWLEQILKSATFSFVLVSHDRYLLDNVTNRIVELGKVYSDGYLKTEGNYSEFLRRREEFLENQLKQEAVLANKMRRENEWLSRGPKARATKAQYRIDSAMKMGEELSDLRRRNRSNGDVEIDFHSTGRKTKRLLEAIGLEKTLGGQKLFDEINLRLSPGSFIGLLGSNGSGKSTLLKILAGIVAPDKGDVKKVDDLKIVMFDQEREQLDQSVTLKKALAPDSDTVLYMGRPVHVVTWAKKFLFSPEQLDMPVGKLSGGEQAKVLIANLMRTPADILLLDEPTNDLDIASLEILEESLNDFPGAVIVASHDRYLLNRLATHVLGFGGDGTAVVYADVEQWIDLLKEKNKGQKKKKDKPQVREIKQAEKKQFSYKHRYELEQIEEKIVKAEGDVGKYEATLADPEISKDSIRLQEVCKLLGDAQKHAEELYNRWEELENLKNQS